MVCGAFQLETIKSVRSLRCRHAYVMHNSFRVGVATLPLLLQPVSLCIKPVKCGIIFSMLCAVVTADAKSTESNYLPNALAALDRL